MNDRYIARWIVSVGVVVLLACGGPQSATLERDQEVARLDESTLSQPTYDVRVERDVRVAMRDGVELSTDLFVPEGPGPYPALVMRTPYGKDWSASISGAAYDAEYFASRGYVVVQQDSRGRYDSDGDFEPFRDDAADGFDTVEWTAAQPWSNGKVSGLGQSYYGLTQLHMAIEAPPHLTTIFPVMTTIDAYNNWIYHDGAFHLSFALPWGTGLYGRGQPRTLPQPRDTTAANAARRENPALSHLPMVDADLKQVGEIVPFYRDWMRHPAPDEFWASRSPIHRLDDLAVPAHYYVGWYDFFLRGALEDYVAIKEHARTAVARDETRLIVGPWPHYTAVEGPPRRIGGFDFGLGALVDLPQLQLRWFDHWLKDMPTGIDSEPPVRLFVMGENYWRSENEWPLSRTVYTNYYFHSDSRANTLAGDGRLGISAPPEAGGATDTFTYDPADPVPTVGGSSGGIAGPGPLDQRSVEAREDVLVYTSEPLTEPLEVTGPITVTLFASSTARDTDFTAKLVDVHPDGYARILQEGVVRARYRKSFDDAELLEPGEIYQYEIDLWATSNVFLSGHRIRVDVSSSSFPRHDRNLNTGEDPATATAMTIATQTIYHDAEHPSHIVLPVIPR